MTRKKDFFVDTEPSGKGRYKDARRYFIDVVLVDRTELMQRRDKECSHRWNGDVCIDCQEKEND